MVEIIQHSSLRFWTPYEAVDIAENQFVNVDETCHSYYNWSKEVFQNAANGLSLIAMDLMKTEAVINNNELRTEIWEAFGEFYQAIKKVDDELVSAIFHFNKEDQCEPIKTPASSLSQDDFDTALDIEKSWSNMKSIMEKAINEMPSTPHWRDLFKNMIKDGDRISSKLLSLLDKKILV